MELTAAHKAALRAHDVFLTDPGRLGDALRHELLEHFTPTQIVELALQFVYWSSNRATVALGDDAPNDPHRIISFHYDENGVYVPHA